MELPIAQLERDAAQLESDISFAKEVLLKAEKYERLMEDKDFKDFLKDFEEGFGIHAKEVDSSLGMLTGSSPRQQEDLFRIILIHQAKKESVKQLVDRPLEIVKLAVEKRKQLPVLEEKLREAQEAINHANA